MTASFVHLRLHTEFSLVDGLVRVKPLVKAVAAAGMPAVAVTDMSNMCSLVKFYKAAMGGGIKPICGADIWLASAEEDGPLSRMTLLAMNPKGYRNLTELVSRGWSEGQSNDLVIIQRDWVKAAAEGLIALSGAKEGEVGHALLNDEPALAEALLREWMEVFPERFYLELQRTNRVNDEEHLHLAVALADKLGAPLVATNDVRFLKQDDFAAHETRVCIGEGRSLDDPRRPRTYSDQQYLKTPEEMAELFSDLPEALENTLEIAKRCNIEVQLGKYFLPDFPVPAGMTMDEYFRQVSFDGLDERLEVLLPKDTPDYDAKKQVYIDRLNFELDIIIQMGFPGYFLIVMDFIKWAKNNGVPVGPGRGSGAGSLVAYVQKITDLDPLAYDLLFERFLNPERVSMPDFDVDFCMDGRDRVIDYVAEKYGRNAVSQIITFGTMAAKAVVRDVARAQGKSYGLADRLSKMIPFEVGMTLEKAYEMEEPLRDFLKVDEDAREIWEMSLKLEGICRGTGKHAGGVVIAPTKLTDFSPIACDDEGGGLVTQLRQQRTPQAAAGHGGQGAHLQAQTRQTRDGHRPGVGRTAHLRERPGPGCTGGIGGPGDLFVRIAMHGGVGARPGQRILCVFQPPGGLVQPGLPQAGVLMRHPHRRHAGQPQQGPHAGAAHGRRATLHHDLGGLALAQGQRGGLHLGLGQPVVQAGHRGRATVQGGSDAVRRTATPRRPDHLVQVQAAAMPRALTAQVPQAQTGQWADGHGTAQGLAGRVFIHHASMGLQPRQGQGDGGAGRSVRVPQAQQGRQAFVGVGQGRQHQVCGHAFTHGPAHHTPAPDIDDHGQIEEAHPGRHVGHVGHPQLVRTCGVETPVDQVMGRGLALVTAGGDGEASALADAVDAGLPHETRHTLAADAHALLDELGTHPGHSVGLVGVLMNLADALGHHRVGDAALGRGTLSPDIEPAG